MRLRPYQREAVDAVIEGFRAYRHQLLVSPTGGGKTIMFAALAGHYQPERTLVIAHREELLEQARDKIARFTGLSPEIEKAESRASLDAPVVVASIQTLSRRQPFAADHFRLIVIDEAHHVLAESYQRVLAHFNGTRVLGVTATPDRGDKRLLADYFENVAHETTLVDLIRDGYLSRIRVKTIPLRIDLSSVHVVAGDFDAAGVGHSLEPHLASIADVVARECAQRKTLAFLPLCLLSERFAKLCRERGIAAEHVDGDSKDRRGVLARLRSGETRLVSNAQLWAEGFDEPSIDCIVPLRPTKIRGLYAQQVGRGTRTHPGKDNLLIVDFLWLSSRHDIIRPAALVAADEEEALRIAGDGDLLENVENDRADRLEKLAQELEANRKRQAVEYDLLEFAVSVGDAELATFSPTMRWHAEPVTPAQAAFLTRCGINAAAIHSKGHACAVIERLMRRRAAGLATFKQVKCLKRFGVRDPHLISFERASHLLTKRFSGIRRPVILSK